MGLADALIARIDRLIRDRLDAAISSRLAASSYVAPDNANIGMIKARTDLIPGVGIPSVTDYSTARAALIDRLDAAVSSRLAASAFIAPDNATITAIYALLDTEIAAILNKVDLIPAAGPPSATNYSASRALKLDNLDDAISSRASGNDYTATRAAKLDKLDELISSRLANNAAALEALTYAITVGEMDALSVSLGNIPGNGNYTSWVELAPDSTFLNNVLIASIAAKIVTSSGTADTIILEIGAGASGSEQTIAREIFYIAGSATNYPYVPRLKRHLANTRLAVRAKQGGSLVINTSYVAVMLYQT